MLALETWLTEVTKRLTAPLPGKVKVPECFTYHCKNFHLKQKFKQNMYLLFIYICR